MQAGIRESASVHYFVFRKSGVLVRCELISPDGRTNLALAVVYIKIPSTVTASNWHRCTEVRLQTQP